MIEPRMSSTNAGPRPLTALLGPPQATFIFHRENKKRKLLPVPA